MKYDVYITLLTPAYGEVIAGRLLNLGWEVSTGSYGLVESTPDTIGAIVVLTIEGDEYDDLENVHTLLENTLESLGASYFSLVVTEATASVWGVGNVKKERKEPVALSSWERLTEE